MVKKRNDHARQPVSLFQLVAGGDPPGGDDVRAVSAVTSPPQMRRRGWARNGPIVNIAAAGKDSAARSTTTECDVSFGHDSPLSRRLRPVNEISPIGS